MPISTNSLNDLIDDCDTVTLTLPPDNEEINITLDDDFGLPSSFYTYHNNIPGSIVTGNTFEDPSLATIKLGGVEITEEKIEKLQALYDVLMEDPEWASKINTQIAFNRLGNNTND